MSQQDTHPPSPLTGSERSCQSVLPPTAPASLSVRGPVGHVIFRALTGALSGALLFLGLCYNIPLTFDLKLAAGGIFVAGCAVGGAFFSCCRCFLLLMFPSMLGSRGQTYLMLLTLTALYSGPVSNIQRNMEMAAESLSCNLDLQVHHGKQLWRVAINPARQVLQELVGQEDEFKKETQSVNSRFQNMRDELLLEHGYKLYHDSNSADSGTTRTTQELFEVKTLKRCETVVDSGVERCIGWFKKKWNDCLNAIKVPILNLFLCLSMKSDFLCGIIKVMTPWCKENIPIEGNFGTLYDSLNLSVDLLSKEFSAKILVQEGKQPPILDKDQLEDYFTKAVQRSLTNLLSTVATLQLLLQLLTTFSFISIITKSISYLRRYQRDFWFDNIYVTRSFRKMDARRRRVGRRCLLPLRPSEMKKLVDPWSVRIHPEELKQVTSGVLRVLSVILLAAVLLSLDFTLFHILGLINRHTLIQFNITSHHLVDIRLEGDSMMSRLLGKMISAFNSSSSHIIQTDNRNCVPPPSFLSVEEYISCVGHILLIVFFSCLQVYTNRLHPAIAALYHPEREKQRIVFLYQLHLHKQTASNNRIRIIGGGRS